MSKRAETEREVSFEHFKSARPQENMLALFASQNHPQVYLQVERRVAKSREMGG
jgi:hypothetical protein